MNPLSGGTVTFLLTDVEQSTRLWEQFPDQMRAALARHDWLGENCITQHGGTLVKARGEGDSLFATFPQATDALAAAITFQKALFVEEWPSETPLRVRMALHTGDVEMRDGDYYGTTVNRCGRIRATAHGGQILISQAIAEIVRDALPSEVTLRDMGLHRLKDLQRPERLVQVLHPALPSDFPPLRSLDAVNHNLPRQLTSFIGRDQEIQKVRSLLGKTCLLTLTGSGGSGKTRLALQVAADLADAYSDGVWLVELAPLPEKAAPDRIAKAIAAALHIKEQAGQETLTSLSEALAAKSLLLLLDNCEHVEHSCRSVVHALLVACPALRVLATSRHHLAVPGETLCPVASLSLPAKNAVLTPADALEYEALRLFVERAQSASPKFSLTSSNLPHVAQICRRLDGIPLAIELAAARVSAMKVIKDIADHLDNAFRFLKAPGVVERHQTLLKTIEWSYALLNDAEKALLRRLSVFVGGWTLEACEAVCAWGDVDHWDVVDLLTRLVQTSLVTMQDDRQDDCEALAEETANAEVRPCRYYLLETLRQFGQEKLEEFGETEQARNHHLDYFLALAEQAEPELTGPHQAHWLERLEADHDNLRTALKWATDGETRLRLACALWRFWYLRGYVSEGSSFMEGTMIRSTHVSNLLRAKGLNGLGVLTWRQSDYHKAQAYLEESLEISKNCKDAHGIAEAQNNLGHVLRDQGHFNEAEKQYQQSLETWRLLANQWWIAATLNNLGTLALNRDDYNTARSYYEESLGIYREQGDRNNLATTANNLGVIANAQDDFAAARTFYEECLMILRELRNTWAVAITLSNLGQVVYELGDLDTAQRHFTTSLLMRRDLNDKSGMSYPFYGLGLVAKARGQWERAAILCGIVTKIRTMFEISVSPKSQEEFSKETAILCKHLGEERFRYAIDRGIAMSLEEAFIFVTNL